MPSSHLILCRPLFLLPPIPSSIRVFSNESTLHMRWPKYWSFSFSIVPSKEGTLKSLLQHHSSKASILPHSAFFIVQLCFFSITGWGIDLDYCDIGWFALKTNRDLSVNFEIALNYCILDSFVDYEGYSISSKEFLSTV